MKADADKEADEVLRGTCRHGRKREDCRECKEHSPQKRRDKGLLENKGHSEEMKYVGKMCTLTYTYHIRLSIEL